MIVPSEQAIDAAVQVLRDCDGGIYYDGAGPTPGAGSVPTEGSTLRQIVGAMIANAAEHLTDAGQPLTDDERSVEYRRGWEAGASNPQWIALPRTCKICGCTDNEACAGGCSWAQPAICSTCADRQAAVDEQYLATLKAQQLHAEVAANKLGAPTEYSVWRDALMMAAWWTPSQQGVEDVEYSARNFARLLRTLGAPPPPGPSPAAGEYDPRVMTFDAGGHDPNTVPSDSRLPGPTGC